MKKYIVETYYTCTFKTVHNLDNLDDIELAKIDQRTDGEVEVLDVKLNNRKTKKLGLKKEEKTQNCTDCHMPKSSSTDIMHVSITDHKIAIPSDEENQKGAFLGLFAINNSNPTHLSKSKAYLKRYESFESSQFYLDSAFKYLQISEHNFTSYIQYYYLKNDTKGLINFVMSNDIDSSKYSKSD